MLPSASKEAATQKAEAIRKEVPKKNPTPLNPVMNKPVTISLGVATFPDDCGEEGTMRDLIAKADAALSRAKKTGRDRVVAA